MVLVLLAVSTFGYVTYYKNTPTPVAPKTTTTQIVDDRISPLVTQGIVFEINRIRNRGIIDVMMKPGSSWKHPPSFYFITDIDGNQYVSKDVQSAGKAHAEELFQTWDSIFMDNKILERTPQEQPTSTLSLTIMEREKMGLFGRKHKDVEKEKINLVYDYRTGHWSGDDSLNDSDGYGHFLGATYEVWFNIYQTSYTSDLIPYWTTINVYHLNGTFDYSHYDPNGDGIPLPWDFKWGYDPFAYDNHSMADPDHDGLTNLEEYQMAKYYADPFHQDIYIESDGMVKGGLLDWPHVFWNESQQFLIERFAIHNICVYIDNGWPGDSSIGGGELLPHINTISQESGMMLQFYKWHFAEDRRGIFRYLVVAHNSGFTHPSVNNRADTMTIDSSPYKMYIRRLAFTPRTQRLLLATAAMHELGHSLGIEPETFPPCDNLSWTISKAGKAAFVNAWGNYKSVMSYYYFNDKKLVDYSDGTHGPGDQNDWAKLDLTYFKRNSEYIESSGNTS